MTTSSSFILAPGTLIEGKWNRRKYKVEQLLGEGANGQVYLVRSGKSIFALKLGFQTLDLQSEVNALQALHKNKEERSPFLVDVDDAVLKGHEVPYYVMQYIKGLSIQDYIERNGSDWLYVIGTHLLQQLDDLHRIGWVFGDLKCENLIVAEFGKVELIDYGGATPMGNAVKQFTELYDRGYWNCGSRAADFQYDLFSMVILFMMLCDQEKRLSPAAGLLPQHRDADYLMEILEDCKALQPIRHVLANIIRQEYLSTREALEDWKQGVLQVQRIPMHKPFPVKWLGGAFVASMMVFAAALYIVLQ